MKYMLMRKADADTEKGVLPRDEVLQATDRFGINWMISCQPGQGA